MYYVHIATLRVLSIDEIRAQHPEASIPPNGDVSILGYEPLTPTPRPAYDDLTQGLRQAPPTHVNGQWMQQWEIFPLPAEDLEAVAIAAQIAARERAKAARAEAVAAIQVTTSSGKVFDGDEAGQGRLARAIIGMQAAGALTWTWTLADNTRAEVTLAELTEALILAGQEQGRLWVLP